MSYTANHEKFRFYSIFVKSGLNQTLKKRFYSMFLLPQPIYIYIYIILYNTCVCVWKMEYLQDVFLYPMVRFSFLVKYFQGDL